MYLSVGNGHNIYFENYGNPKGIKILFLHGGPGLGFSNQDKIIFDSDKFNVTFIDQRGSGKSTPKGGLSFNTTFDLLEDIDRVLDHLKIDSVIVFGGSWGATLAILYAAKRPQKVNKLILRGFFPATKECTDILIRGKIKLSHPEQWKRVKAQVPEEWKDREAEFYFQQIIAKTKRSESLAYEWARYGLSLSRKQISQEELDSILKVKTIDLDRICIELNYALNGFFIPEGHVYNQAKKIKNTPTIIVQGEYDYICPSKEAKYLAAIIPGARLILVDAGHAVSETPIMESLNKELARLI